MSSGGDTEIDQSYLSQQHHYQMPKVYKINLEDEEPEIHEKQVHEFMDEEF